MAGVKLEVSDARSIPTRGISERENGARRIKGSLLGSAVIRRTSATGAPVRDRSRNTAFKKFRVLFVVPRPTQHGRRRPSLRRVIGRSRPSAAQQPSDDPSPAVPGSTTGIDDPPRVHCFTSVMHQHGLTTQDGGHRFGSSTVIPLLRPGWHSEGAESLGMGDVCGSRPCHGRGLPWRRRICDWIPNTCSTANAHRAPAAR